MNSDTGSQIAIVGMAGRFSDWASTAELWQALCSGQEAIRALSTEELRRAGISETELSDPSYIRYGAPMSNIEYFDAEFFGLTPAEAALVDPQHRIFIECAWRALEDAGVGPGGRVGVFASTGYANYLEQNLAPRHRYSGHEIPYSVRIANEVDFLPSRLCHMMDFTGPSIALRTACSSALVAVAVACTELKSRRCDAAVAGAASLHLPLPGGYRYSRDAVWSKDGHCRPFDAQASGWVAGNGAGVVVLKRLADALADRDRVYAVISGIGMNNDGADKTSFTAPSTSAQLTVIHDTITDAGIATTDIGYVEAHGSGTPIGDALEVTALAKAYAAAGGLAPGCGIGAVKANIGHMAEAAGIAGLIKAALVIHHQLIPPQINFDQLNPWIPADCGGLTIYRDLHACLSPLAAAAVTSLGMGGTNVHMILTTPPKPPQQRSAPPDREYLIPLWAHNHSALRIFAEDLLRHLLTNDVRIDDLAYSLSCRWAQRQDAAVILRARTTEELQVFLRRYLADDPLVPTAPVPDVGSWVDIESPPAVKIPLPGQPLNPRPHWIEPVTQPADDKTADIQPHTSASGNLLDEVVRIFREHLGINDLGPDADFDALGGKSLTAVEIVDAIADRLGPIIGLGKFVELGTPRRIADELRTWVSGNVADPSIVKLRDGAAGEEIFFIYPVNGTVFCYHKMIQNTTFNKPVYALAYPFEIPNPPSTFGDMAEQCITEIRAISAHGPYRLAGYSMGGNLAVEMTHRLEQEGESVTDIVMIDSLPLKAYPRPPIEIDYIRAAEITLAYFLGLSKRSSTATTIGDVVATFREPTWSPRTEKTMYRFVEYLVHNAMAITAADQPPPIAADLTILAATDRRNEVYDLVGISDLPPQTWQEFTTGRVAVTELPGNHYSLYTEPANFPLLVRALDRIYS
jgi:3-oxoacyl-(acyl-carrier-protein) synthase/thioesterase domain-containing protein/acyl carrier protein